MRDLVESAINMVRNERESEVRGTREARRSTSGCSICCCPCRADIAATPQPRAHAGAPRGGARTSSSSRPAAATSHETDAMPRSAISRTREKLKQLLLDGQLDEREVEVEVTQQSP